MDVIITSGCRIDGKPVAPSKTPRTVSLELGRDLIYAGKAVLHVPAPTVKRVEPDPDPVKSEKAEPKPRAKKAAPKKVG